MAKLTKEIMKLLLESKLRDHPEDPFRLSLGEIQNACGGVLMPVYSHVRSYMSPKQKKGPFFDACREMHINRLGVYKGDRLLSTTDTIDLCDCDDVYILLERDGDGSVSTESGQENVAAERPVVHNHRRVATSSSAFTARTISDCDALKFFVYTSEFYKRMVDAHRGAPLRCNPNGIAIDDIQKVYFIIDRNILEADTDLTDDEYVFKMLVVHSLNRQGTMDFDSHQVQIKEYCCGYDVNLFNRFLSSMTDQGALEALKSCLDVSDKQCVGLFKTLKSICAFLMRKPGNCSTRAYIKALFMPFMTPTIDYKGIVDGFRTEHLYGYGEALPFDFLKELDPDFDLPKPDLHICRTIASLFHSNRDYTAALSHTPLRLQATIISPINGSTNVMSLYLGLMDQIRNEACRIDGNVLYIRNYILDKMIYLLCSGNLYLQVLAGGRKKDRSFVKEYLKGIQDDSFKATPIPSNLSVWFRYLI